jgi:hypothetical protein
MMMLTLSFVKIHQLVKSGVGMGDTQTDRETDMHTSLTAVILYYYTYTQAK